MRFALKTTSDTDKFFARSVAEDFKKSEKFRLDLQNKLNMTPGQFSMKEIFEEIAKPLGIDRIQYDTLMLNFQMTGTIEIDEDRNVKLKGTQY